MDVALEINLIDFLVAFLHELHWFNDTQWLRQCHDDMMPTHTVPSNQIAILDGSCYCHAAHFESNKTLFILAYFAGYFNILTV